MVLINMTNVFPSIIKTFGTKNNYINFKQSIDANCSKLINFPPNSVIKNNAVFIPYVGNNVYNGTIEIVVNNKRIYHNVKIY